MANPYKHTASGSPYYDDFDPKKNYVKILHNPGVALQSRELTQAQTYLDYQMATIGGYLFKDGTPVDGAKISYSTKQPVIRISTTDSDGAAIKLDELVNKKFIGQKSEQMIEVTDYYIDNSDTSEQKYYLLFSYMGTEISPGEVFISYGEANVRKFVTINTPVQNAMVAGCTEGHLFIDGYFPYVSKSNVVVAIPTNDTTIYHIGFKITRNIITANEDSTLHDPAAGTYNYKAPGADRYQLKTELISYSDDNQPIDTEYSGISYVTGIIVKGDTVIKEQDIENSSALTDLLARRTYEESGSYTVNPWKVQIKDHPSDSSKYIVSIEPGTGYIYGYRVSTLVSKEIEVDKPRTWQEKQNNLDYIPDGIYTYAKYESNSNSDDYNLLSLQASYFPSFLTLEKINVMTGEKGTGKLLGTCKITDLYKQGNYLLVYITDASDVIGSFSSAKSLVSATDPSKYVNLYLNSENCAEIYGTDSAKIIPTGYSMITPSVSSIDNSVVENPMNGSIEYQFIKTYTSIASKTTKTSITFNTNNDGYEFDTTGLLYIYDSSNGKHVDITNLVVSVSSNSVTITNQNVSDIFTEGHAYVVCGRVGYTEGSIRQKYAVLVQNTFTVNKGVDKLVLPHEDIIDILSVTYNGKDYKDRLTLDNGQRDFVYDYGSISGFSSINQELNSVTYTISYRYYNHGSVAGPFSSGSYVNNTNKNVLSDYADLYSMIPIYRSTATGTRYQLRDCLDFRVKVSELSTNGLSYFPSSRTKIKYNAGIYLPRIDAVWVDKVGNFGVTTGIPSQSPEPPEEKDGTMNIYYIYNEAYVHSIKNVNLKYINNQRYTMTDINKLENRIYNVENVVSLSMLEQSAVNMQVPDETGLNRYKTGIFTDNFSSFDNSDYTNEDWNSTIDSVECSIRPLFECEEHPFELAASDSNSLTNGVEKNDVILTLKNTGKSIFAQNNALSEATNIQSLMFYVWIGSLKLTPSIDTWVTDLGQFVVSETYIETPKPPTTYRTWSTTSITDIKQNSSTYSVGRDFHSPGYWIDTYQTTDNYAIKETKTTTETTSYVGSWSASDKYTQMESQDTYMRVRDIEYKLSGMRPGIKLIATMDGVQLNLSNNTVSSDGTLTGTFKVPEKMTVGTKLVEFYDESTTTATSAEYTANGKTVWTNVDRTYIRTWTSVTTSSTSTSSNSIYLNTNTTKVSTVFVNEDPIAESFYIDNTNGIMLESIDLYFAKKDPSINVEVFIVECENGYPGQTMVPFSRVSLQPSQVNITDIDSISYNQFPKATNFKFESPIYLAPETEYAFVVIAPSYNYEIYTSTLGKADLVTGIGIKEQPYTGSMFKSQNLRTWTAEQLSDITFKMYKYSYDTSSKATAIFNIKTPEKDFECAMETLAINSFVPNQTNIDYYYKWLGDASWTQFNNKEDIFNSKIRTLTTNTDSGISLQLRLEMNTLDSNLSPMIDLEQVYGIFTNNIVSESDDEKYVYKCGTYISNSVSLENSSNDLRVILDTILPNESGIKVSFKTTSYKPMYVKHSSAGFCIDSQSVYDNVGQILQVYYYNSTQGKFVLPKSNSQSQCIVTGYDEAQRKVYLRSVSNQSDFFNTFAGDGTEENYPDLSNENITAICLLPILGTTEITCPTWTTKSFNAGDYVLYDGYMWKALIQTIAANTPSELSIAWKKVNGIKTVSTVNVDDTVIWRPMENDSISKTTDPSTGFIEYSFKPSIDIESEFTDFAIRIDMYSQDKVNVPRVKNLRAIAVV